MSTNPISTLTINCPIIIKPTAVSLAARVTAAYHIQLEAIFDPGMCIVTYVREKTMICLFDIKKSYEKHYLLDICQLKSKTNKTDISVIHTTDHSQSTLWLLVIHIS